jgi:hypothetical protein
MPPGVELAERIEQAKVLVIVHAWDVLADRTAKRDNAQPMRALRREGFDRVADLQRAVCTENSNPDVMMVKPAEDRV